MQRALSSLERLRENTVMRFATALVICALFVISCNRSPQLTPEQQQKVEAARAATVSTSERLLGRQLTDSERECIHVTFRDGRVVGSIAAPLSETLKGRQAQVLEQSKKSQ